MSQTSHSTTTTNHTGGPHSQSSCGATNENLVLFFREANSRVTAQVQLKGGAVTDRKLANVTLYLEDTV